MWKYQLLLACVASQIIVVLATNAKRDRKTAFKRRSANLAQEDRFNYYKDLSKFKDDHLPRITEANQQFQRRMRYLKGGDAPVNAEIAAKTRQTATQLETMKDKVKREVARWRKDRLGYFEAVKEIYMENYKHGVAMPAVLSGETNQMSTPACPEGTKRINGICVRLAYNA